MPKCDLCGRSFDSKRGLGVHKAQMHKTEDKKTDLLGMRSHKPWILAGIIVIMGFVLMLTVGGEPTIDGESYPDGGILQWRGSHTEEDGFSRDLSIGVEKNTTEGEDMYAIE